MKREKNILFILTILLLLACTACYRSTRHVTEHLSQAEELIWTAPDSALHLLESISASRHLTGKEQADYALLLSLAQYRCYIPVSSDSPAPSYVPVTLQGCNHCRRNQASVQLFRRRKPPIH